MLPIRLLLLHKLPQYQSKTIPLQFYQIQHIQLLSTHAFNLLFFWKQAFGRLHCFLFEFPAVTAGLDFADSDYALSQCSLTSTGQLKHWLKLGHQLIYSDKHRPKVKSGWRKRRLGVGPFLFQYECLPAQKMRVCDEDIANLDDHAGYLRRVHKAEEEVYKEETIGQFLDWEVHHLCKVQNDILDLLVPFFHRNKRFQFSISRHSLARQVDEELQCLRKVGHGQVIFLGLPKGTCSSYSTISWI